MDVFRQGDIVLIRVSEFPKESEEVKPFQGKTVLGFGEVTGHMHAIPLLDAKQYKSGDKEFVEVFNQTQLRHEEHGPIDLEPGIYEKRIAREYVNSEIVRKVVD